MKKYYLFLAIILLGADLFAQAIEKKGYIGITLGPSFPLADFADNSLSNTKAGYAKRGFSDSFINFGYRFG